MLEEMGLTPVWRLRSGGNPADTAEASGPQPTPVEPAAALKSGVVITGASLVTGHRSPVTAGGDRRVAIMSMDWPALKSRVAGCTDCPLHQKRTKTVFGVGDENADWMFVGEGPGAEEDAKGEPFVGQAGRLLDNMLPAIGLRRGKGVYIANCVKCRPPGNRNPEPGEASQCEPFLHRQIELIRPKLIVALGKVAAANLLATDASVASMRGKVHRYRDTPLIVTYHPAYLLRNLPDKAKAWADLCFAARVMQGLRDGKAVPT